jgi:hypothetical protein
MSGKSSPIYQHLLKPFWHTSAVVLDHQWLRHLTECILFKQGLRSGAAAAAPGILELLDVLVAAHHVDGLDALVLGVLDELQMEECDNQCSLKPENWLSSARWHFAALAALDGAARCRSRYKRSWGSSSSSPPPQQHGSRHPMQMPDRARWQRRDDIAIAQASAPCGRALKMQRWRAANCPAAHDNMQVLDQASKLTLGEICHGRLFICSSTAKASSAGATFGTSDSCNVDHAQSYRGCQSERILILHTRCDKMLLRISNCLTASQAWLTSIMP